MTAQLQGRIALVAGATRGAGRGIAAELGSAGAVVYATGRSTREGRSDYDRPETIEDTAQLVTSRGGTGIPVQVDHTDPQQVRQLVERIDTERGRLDLLVNDLGGEHLMVWDTPIWETSLDKGNTASLSAGHLARVYGFTDADGSQPDAWRYIQEVEWAGRSADAADYR